MIEILKAILFGIVEGITEWIPVSSTGHLILLNEWVKFNLEPEREAAFMEMYDVVIQLGAILAVVLLSWKVIWPFGIAKKEGEKKTSKKGSEESWKLFGSVIAKKKTIFMWLKIALACVPGLLYGFLLDDMVEELTAEYKPYIVAVMLILVGILFIIIEKKNEDKRPKIKTIPELTWQIALIIGISQLVAAALPGTSRSGATILVGIMLGLSRSVATKFTFFLAIPTMFGASLIKFIKYMKDGMTMNGSEAAILGVSFFTAFIVSVFTVQFLTIYISKNKGFKPFGIYRIVLGAIVLAYFVIGGLI